MAIPASSLTVVSPVLPTDDVIITRDDETLLRATIASLFTAPAITGDGTATTQATSDSSTKIATTAYVKAQAVGRQITTDHIRDTTGLSGSPDSLTEVLQRLFLQSINGVSYTWATRPAAASYTNKVIRITDVGIGGSLWISDGTYWKPLGGSVILGRSGAASVLTGTTSETALATVTVPALAMGASGKVIAESSWSFTGSTNSKSARTRFNGAGGTVYSLGTTTTAANVGFATDATVSNRAATNSQIGNRGAATHSGGFFNSAAPTSAVDTTAAVDVVFTGQLANSGETITLEAYTVRLVA